MGLLEDLQSKILVGDGAMGTLLYSFGIGSCFEEHNLTHPDQIKFIHNAYLEAGANVIQTNTYAANYEKLRRYELEDKVKEINTAAVRLARDAVGRNAYVVGTMGGMRAFKKQNSTIEEIKRNFREQLFYLLSEDVDGLMLETYYDLEELSTVVEIARKETHLPIIAQLSLHDAGIVEKGVSVNDAFTRLEELGADVVGLNCRLGPYHINTSLARVELPKRAFISAYPNAGLPDYIDGKLTYQSEPSYFAQSAISLRNQGARLIGGCCGTTPEHIRAIAEAVKGTAPLLEKIIEPAKNREAISVSETVENSVKPLHMLAKERETVIVELDSPKNLNLPRFYEGITALKEAGVDAVTIADNSLASPRVCNLAMGAVAKGQLGANPLIHVACRDRNVIGLQSHLMGLHALGITELLAVTGDPTKVGDFPGATSVYDVSSLELIRMIKGYNEGVSYSGKQLSQKTNFSIAAAFNPNVRHLDKAVQRLEQKIACGADYFLTQPLFSEKQIEEVYQSTKHLNTPIFIGIMPLTSYRNAEFLHHEVPGIKLTDETRKRMAYHEYDDKSAQLEGIEISKSLIDAAIKRFNGIYLITPFLRYETTVQLTKYVQKRVQADKERKNSSERNVI